MTLLTILWVSVQESFCNNYYPVWTLLGVQKIYYVGKNEKKDFYELWQQHKQLKTKEMCEVWPDTYD